MTEASITLHNTMGHGADCQKRSPSAGTGAGASSGNGVRCHGSGASGAESRDGKAAARSPRQPLGAGGSSLGAGGTPPSGLEASATWWREVYGAGRAQG